jgi:hypothetical protein
VDKPELPNAAMFHSFPAAGDADAWRAILDEWPELAPAINSEDAARLKTPHGIANTDRFGKTAGGGGSLQNRR